MLLYYSNNKVQLKCAAVLTLHYTNAGNVTQPLLALCPISLPSLSCLLLTLLAFCHQARCQRKALNTQSVCVCPYLVRWHFGSTMRYNRSWRWCVGGAEWVTNLLSTAERKPAGAGGCLQEPLEASTLMHAHVWADACAFTSSWTLILARSISNRPEHSHLPLLCPSDPSPNPSFLFNYP